MIHTSTANKMQLDVTQVVSGEERGVGVPPDLSYEREAAGKVGQV